MADVRLLRPLSTGRLAGRRACGQSLRPDRVPGTMAPSERMRSHGLDHRFRGMGADRSTVQPARDRIPARVQPHPAVGSARRSLRRTRSPERRGRSSLRRRGTTGRRPASRPCGARGRWAQAGAISASTASRRRTQQTAGWLILSTRFSPRRRRWPPAATGCSTRSPSITAAMGRATIGRNGAPSSHRRPLCRRAPARDSSVAMTCRFAGTGLLRTATEGSPEPAYGRNSEGCRKDP